MIDQDGNITGMVNGLANQVFLQGILVEPVQGRTTPTGRPITHITLEHDGEVMDLPPLRRLTVRMNVVAMDDLANVCRELFVGQSILVSGRLNQQRFLRSGVLRWGRLELVANKIEVLAAPEVTSMTKADQTPIQGSAIDIAEIDPKDGQHIAPIGQAPIGQGSGKRTDAS